MMTRAERREKKRRIKMVVSNRSIFNIQKIRKNKHEWKTVKKDKADL